MLARAKRGAESLSDLGCGGDAPANPVTSCPTLLAALDGAISNAAIVGRCARTRGPAALAGPWLLLTCSPAASRGAAVGYA